MKKRHCTPADARWIIGIWADSTLGNDWDPRRSGVSAWRNLSEDEAQEVIEEVRRQAERLRDGRAR